MTEWMGRFFEEHRSRHPHAKLPDPVNPIAAPMYRAWAAELVKAGVDYASATVASERLILEPAKAEKWHFATLLSFAAEALLSRQPAGPKKHDLSTHDGCEAASCNCDRCGGVGLTTVWHPRPSYEDRIPAMSAAYCVCALGRWIRGSHAARHPDVRSRIPDLDDVIAGRSVWLAEAPGLLVDQTH